MRQVTVDVESKLWFFDAVRTTDHSRHQSGDLQLGFDPCDPGTLTCSATRPGNRPFR